ncbi:MAG TPA: protein-L-isoaspartate(D-aspartate) O-methyltransferase [Pirellulaceae bacterium]|nr:protein-L-isoaspartate(D-aspartate) O-methyltransferase [Pirellulaceae bacterium]
MKRRSIDYAQRRHHLVDITLRKRGICDPRVLAAMRSVPREEFVSTELHDVVYDDCAQSIGSGQTISQPFTVAFMVRAAQLSESDTILEIGTGSGYGAAVLSQLGATVHSIERLPELAELASQRLQAFGHANVQVHVGDGSLGLADYAPFDAIVVTAGAAALPDAYREQLREGGRIVIPIGKTPTRQQLVRFTRRRGKLQFEDLGAFAFVPLAGRNGWSPDA